MGRTKRDDQRNEASPNTRRTEQHEQPASRGLPASLPGQAAYDRVLHYIEEGHYQKALELLRSAQRTPRVQNALGVCLMRLGRAEDAVRIYRDLVLSPGGFGIRPDSPVILRVNFATSLLLAGHPAGCLDALAGLRDDMHPSVSRLRGVIKQWERSLSCWQRWNWRFGRIEPRDAPVTFVVPPGELEVDSPDPADHKPSVAEP